MIGSRHYFLTGKSGMADKAVMLLLYPREIASSQRHPRYLLGMPPIYEVVVEWSKASREATDHCRRMYSYDLSATSMKLFQKTTHSFLFFCRCLSDI